MEKVFDNSDFQKMYEDIIDGIKSRICMNGMSFDEAFRAVSKVSTAGVNIWAKVHEWFEANGMEDAVWSTIDDKKLLIGLLHWNGMIQHLLPQWAIRGIYLKCDGFGELGYDESRKTFFLISDPSTTLEWDWSHVRDASDESKAKAVDLAKTLLKVRDKLSD